MKNVMLEKAIKEQGRVIKWIAKQTGISLASLYSYVEGHRNPKSENAIKIATLLNVPVEQLFNIKIKK